jgi:hypothetical protein
MTRQHNSSENLKSIAGGVLVGLGLHVLSANLGGEVTRLKHVLSVPGGEALGVLPSLALAASQVAQTYAVDHQGFLDSLLQMLAAFWPLLLVIAGTILLWDALADRVKKSPERDNDFQNKYFQKRDVGCRFRCPSFDA